MFLTNWPLLIEILSLILFLAAVAIVVSILMMRSLRSSYKDVFNFQSKFDIELRKVLNLIEKTDVGQQLEDFKNVVVKNLDFEAKKHLLQAITLAYGEIDIKDVQNRYLSETYEALQETRRVRDSKALVFNQKIQMFPFNLYARLMKFGPWEVYTDQ